MRMRSMLAIRSPPSKVTVYVVVLVANRILIDTFWRQQMSIYTGNQQKLELALGVT